MSSQKQKGEGYIWGYIVLPLIVFIIVLWSKAYEVSEQGIVPPTIQDEQEVFSSKPSEYTSLPNVAKSSKPTIDESLYTEEELIIMRKQSHIGILLCGQWEQNFSREKGMNAKEQVRIIHTYRNDHTATITTEKTVDIDSNAVETIKSSVDYKWGISIKLNENKDPILNLIRSDFEFSGHEALRTIERMKNTKYIDILSINDNHTEFGNQADIYTKELELGIKMDSVYLRTGQCK